MNPNDTHTHNNKNRQADNDEANNNNKNIDIVASLYSLLIITTIVYINVKNNQYFHNNCVCVWKKKILIN